MSDDFDLDVFVLELEHQIETRVKPELKRVLDRREAEFLACMDAHPAVIAERARCAREWADYRRRVERRRYVASGEAAYAAHLSTTQLR